MSDIRIVYGKPTKEELACMFGHEEEPAEEDSFRDGDEEKPKPKRKKRKPKI